MGNKPKIVIFSAFYSPYMSGAELFVKEVTERLADKYEFWIITSRLSPKLNPLEIKEKYIIRRVGLGFIGDKFLFTFLAPLVALSYKPKITHAIMESYAGIALWLFRILNRKIPTILTLQSGSLDDFRKQKKIPGWLWKKIHLTPERITSISYFLARRAEKLGFPKRKISIIPNGVDLDIQPKNISRIPFRIICVARLSWQKGVNYLVGALPEIRDKFPQARLVLVGDGPEKRSLKQQVKKLNLEKEVAFKGKLSHQEVLEELSRSAVFVCPSLAEGLGIVFIEAQANGLPVVGTNVGGIPEVIKDNFNGLLIKSKNSQAISQAIIKIFSQPALAKKLVENAQKTVNKFSWPDISQQVNQLYQELLSPKIIIATGVYPPDIGGPGTHAKRLAEEFKKRKIEVKVITYSDDKRQLIDDQSQSEFPIIRVPRKRFLPWRYFLYFWNLSGIARKANIIYVYNLLSSGLPAILVKKIFKKKIVLRLGGDFQWEKAVQKKFYNNILEQYYIDKKFSFLEKIIYTLTNFVLAKADYIVFNAHILRDIYTRHRKVDKNKTTVIENIKPIAQANYQLKQTKDCANILFAGRLTAFKNILGLIKAFASLKDKWPKEVILEIIGQGPQQKELENYVKERKLNNKVKILSKLNHHDLVKKIQQSDIMANVSLTEVNAHFVSEALTLDKPIILTKKSESYYLGDDNDLIYYVDPLDSENIARNIKLALDRLFNNYRYPSKEQKEKIVWDSQRVAKIHLELFNELLSK